MISRMAHLRLIPWPSLNALTGGTVIPTGIQVITFEQWRLHVTPKLTHDQAKHRNQAFKLAAERLIANGDIGKHNDLVWKATP